MSLSNKNTVTLSLTCRNTSKANFELVIEFPHDDVNPRPTNNNLPFQIDIVDYDVNKLGTLKIDRIGIEYDTLLVRKPFILSVEIGTFYKKILMEERKPSFISIPTKFLKLNQ